MGRGWKCPRCSNRNGEGVINCATCGSIRGGVFVPSAYSGPGTFTSPAAANAQHPGEVQANGWVRGSEATAGRSIWWRLRYQLGIGVLVVLAVGASAWRVNGDDPRSRDGATLTDGSPTDATPTPTEVARAPGELDPQDLRFGDCWDEIDPKAETIGPVAIRACTEPHRYELFFRGSLPGGPFPTDDTINQFTESNCDPAFGEYTGTAFQDSPLNYQTLVPSAEGWLLGDREISCSAFDPQNSRLTWSLMNRGHRS